MWQILAQYGNNAPMSHRLGSTRAGRSEWNNSRAGIIHDHDPWNIPRNDTLIFTRQKYRYGTIEAGVADQGYRNAILLSERALWRQNYPSVRSGGGGHDTWSTPLILIHTGCGMSSWNYMVYESCLFRTSSQTPFQMTTHGKSQWIFCLSSDRYS